MECGSRVLHLWRWICQQWPMVEQGILWIIKNGIEVRLWQDSWVSEMGALSDLALVNLSDHEYFQTMNDYVTLSEWNWPLLAQVLPSSVCSKIVSIGHPNDGSEDFPIWQHFTDGIFSIKSAYDMLFQLLDRDVPDAPFTSLWKVRTPPRINTFLCVEN